MVVQAGTDAAVLASIAPTSDHRWRDLFALPLWTRRFAGPADEVDQLVGLLYELKVVVPFDWPGWYSLERYPGGRGIESASAADAVRLITSYVRGDRFSEGAFAGGLDDGTVKAAIDRLWSWYRQEVAGDHGFVDWAEYSKDGVYRWSYERRWAPGGMLCWVGLNPGTGDRNSGPRPTLGRVVGWAKREGCAAVRVVNLYSFRCTNPKELRRDDLDIVGERTDEKIRDASRRAQVSLVAWGSNKLAKRRSAEVLEMVIDPMCVGTTKHGEPRHPLYVAASAPFRPYRRS